jgi:hypothetical protein
MLMVTGVRWSCRGKDIEKRGEGVDFTAEQSGQRSSWTLDGTAPSGNGLLLFWRTHRPRRRDK